MITGHIRKRNTKTGKPTYQIIIEAEKDPLTGKRQRIYRTVNGTKKEAEAMLAKMRCGFENGDMTKKASAIKLSDWMNEWLTSYVPNIADTTRAGYEERIRKRIKDTLGRYPLNTLNTKIIQDWVNNLTDEGLAAKTIKNVFLNLDAAIEKAVKLKMIPDNPCKEVVLPQLVKYQASVYNNQEIALLLQEAKGTDMELFVTLALALGLRRGELAALKWTDVDFDNAIVHITRSRVLTGKKKITKTPKTTSGIRSIGVGDNVLHTLKTEHDKYLQNTHSPNFFDSGYIIHKEDGTPYSPDSLTQKWVRFRHQHHLRDIRLHDLRHTSATAMLAKGVESKVIQTRLGHANIQTTLNIYAHCLPSMNKEAGDKLDTLFDS